MRALAAATVAALGASAASAGDICKSGMATMLGVGQCLGVNASNCNVDFEYDEDEQVCSLMPYAMSKTVYDQWKAGTSFGDLCTAAGGEVPGYATQCSDLPQTQGIMDMISGMKNDERRAATQNNQTTEPPPSPPPETPTGPKLYSKEWCDSKTRSGMSVWETMQWMALLSCCDGGETMCYKPSVCGDPTKFQRDHVAGWMCEGLDSSSCSGTGFEWNGEECEVMQSSSVSDPAAACTDKGGRPRSPRTCALLKATAEGWSPGQSREAALKWRKAGGSWSTQDCEIANRFVESGCCGDGMSICNTDPADVVLTTAGVESALADVGIGKGSPVAGLESLGDLVSDPVVEQLASGAQELLFTFAGSASVTEDDKASLAQSVADAVGVAVSRCTVSILARGRRAAPLEVSLKVTIAPSGTSGDGGTGSPVVDVGTTSPAAVVAGPFALAAAAAAAFAAMC